MKKHLVAASAVVPLLIIALAGCSSSSDSPPGSDSAKSGSAKTSTVSDLEWRTAVASCMRGKGHEFPDPDPSGDGIGLTIDGDRDAWMKDYESCQKATTDDLGEAPVTAGGEDADQEAFDDQLAYAQCLRKKGYEISDPQRDSAGRAFGGESDDSGKKIAPNDEAACSPVVG